MTEHLHPEPSPPLGLWHLLHFFEETAMSAHTYGAVNENEIIAALVRYKDEDLWEALGILTAGIQVGTVIRTCLAAALVGQFGDPRKLRDQLGNKGATDSLEAVLRAAEEPDFAAWVEDEAAAIIARWGADDPVTLEQTMARWCIGQFLALMVEYITTPGLSEDLAYELLAARIARYNGRQLRWVYLLGDDVLSVGGVAIQKLREIDELRQSIPAPSEPRPRGHSVVRPRFRRRRRRGESSLDPDEPTD